VSPRIKPRRGVHVAVADVLREIGPCTASAIAQHLGQEYFGVAACLAGMHRRREVTRRISAPGQPAIWRLA